MSKKIWAVLTNDDECGQIVLGCYTKEDEANKAYAWWDTGYEHYWIEEYELHTRFKEYE